MVRQRGHTAPPEIKTLPSACQAHVSQYLKLHELDIHAVVRLCFAACELSLVGAPVIGFLARP